MLTGKTKIASIGGGNYLLIPKSVFNDSAFPFKIKGNLTIEIKGKKLIIYEGDKSVK